MSKQRQILQLLHDGHLSTRKVAAALHISKSSVGDIAKAARLAGLDWEGASKLSDDELSARIYRSGTTRTSALIEPEYNHLYRELKRADVTRVPGTTRYRKPRLFVATLRYSRRSFRRVAWNSSQETWARLHEQAWRYFGGSCRYVVLET
jgi:transposase